MSEYKTSLEPGLYVKEENMGGQRYRKTQKKNANHLSGNTRVMGIRVSSGTKLL